MACENCNELFDGDFLCINIGDLQYGVQFQGVSPDPVAGQTTVSYYVCNCNSGGGGTGISHINFELCPGGILPVSATANGTDAEIDPAGDDIFGVPNFKIENFGDVDAGECLTFMTSYSD